jgi:hypothetical protein
VPGKSAKDAAELLDLIEQRAPALIAAGITHITIGDLSATLSSAPRAPAPAPAATPGKPPTTPTPTKPPAKRHIDPLRDASTYAGGRVPGFSRKEDRTFE